MASHKFVSAGSSYAFKYITRLVIKYMWVCFIQC